MRNVYDFDCGEETSFWYVIKDKFGGMGDIPSKHRGRIRKALERYEIRLINAEYLLEFGYNVYVKAAENYRVKSEVPTMESFRNRINNCDDSFDFWGCIDKETGELCAFAINKLNEDNVDYQTMKYEPKSMSKYHCSYGIIYEMNRYYLEEKGFKFVNDGARSITNHSSIQPFLIEKFGFRKAYCRLHLTYKWWFGLIVKSLYPFRRFIKIAKVQAILNMEAMARNEI